MTYAQITPPSVEPLTLAEAKAHMRLDAADEDALITALISVARNCLEHVTGLCLMSQGRRLYLDGWPANGIVRIAHGPVISVDAVTVYDVDGTPEILSLDGQWLDGVSRPARFWLPRQVAPGRAMNGIEVDFTAGFGETGADVPDELKRAMLMHVALMFSYRGVVSASDQPAAMPEGYARLVAPYTRKGL